MKQLVDEGPHHRHRSRKHLTHPFNTEKNGGEYKAQDECAPVGSWTVGIGGEKKEWA